MCIRDRNNAYTRSDVIWAKLNLMEDRWRRNQDISLPPPPQHIFIPVPPLNGSAFRDDKYSDGSLGYKDEGDDLKYFLTFKGKFRTHPIRKKLGEMHNPGQGVIIVDSSGPSSKHWDFAEIMTMSKFTLVVKGDVEFSYRYTEAVCSGAVPVLVADGWVPPLQSLVPFETYGVRIKEDEIDKMLDVLHSKWDVMDTLRREAKRVCQEYMGSLERQVESLLHIAWQQIGV